jgi:hypothetical protein
VLEELEPRWAPAWLGVPPATITPPASAVQVTFNAQNDATGSAAIASTEVDYYSFTAPASGLYTLSAATPTSNLDPVLGLFSSTGQRRAYNDDISSSNTDSRLNYSLTAGTRYYVGITNYTGSAGGAYTWTIDGPAGTGTDDALENNDTRTTAYNLGTLTAATTRSNLVMADGHDWYRFTTSGAGTASDFVQIAFTHAQGDLDLELYNSAGTRLAFANGTSNSERITLSGRAAGTYYVHVYGYQGAANPSYSLTIDPPGAALPPTPGIDLVGASLTTTASSLWGQTITVQSQVRNAGNTASGAFSTQWVLSRDTVGSSDDIVLAQTTGATSRAHTSIAGGATGASFSTTLRLPTALPAGWSGSSFYVIMRSDSASQVTETNENNNFGQAGAGLDRAAITITTTAPPAGGFTITVISTGLTASQQAAFTTAANRWAQVITGDLPNATYNGIAVDDLLIHASGVAIDGSGGILGQAGPDRFRTSGGLPYHGEMEFDTADLASMEQSGQLVGLIIHEMGHVLGFGTLWSSRGLLSGAGTSNPRFTGAQATAAYNQIFGRNETGVPVENTGGSGTRDSHWRETTFGNELMTGWIGPGNSLPLSRVTAGSLADIGYQVNMNAADNYTPPASASASGGSGGSTSPSLLAPNAVDYWMAALNRSGGQREELLFR